MSDETKPDQLVTTSNRRDFLKLGALAGLGAAVSATIPGCTTTGHRPRPGPLPTEPFAAPPIEHVRIGFVGVGGMGTHHIRTLLRIEGVQIKAICDIRAAHAKRAQQFVEEASQPSPTLYTRGERDFERLCAEEDLDLVFNATPWRWHVPICVAAMTNGKHAATEVPAAVTIDECWQLVETAEKKQKHCVMMENCCYDHAELMCLNMVRRGLLGEVLHGEGGYLHDLRGVKFSKHGEGLWGA